MEEESFELLSSLSPKVKNCQKHFRKGTTVLALRKSLRKSSIHDKSIHTGKNEDLVITEISSTTTTATSNSKSSSSRAKLANTTPISIHDSDSENEAILTTKKNKSSKIVKHNDGTVISKVKKNSMLSRDKFENIKHWVDSVNFQIELKDSSAYSELSTIYGGESGTNFITERTGRAVNSTFIGSASIHFEELFKQKTDILSQPKEELKVITNEPDEIDESYVEKDTRSDKIMENVKNTIYRLDDVDLISNSDKSVISSSSKRKSEEKSNLNKDCISKSDEDIVNESDNSFSLDGSLKTRLKNKTNISSERKISRKILNNKYPENNRDNSGKVDKDIENVNENELASMLDDLYGNKWRERADHVLPKSEPRKRIPKPNSLSIINTEGKPKLSVLYKNPYLESEKLKSDSLLRTLQKSRLKNYMESPALHRLHSLCDSDTSPDVSEDKVIPRVKLNFDDSDCEDDVGKTLRNNEKITSKYFKNITRSNKKPELESKSVGNESDRENLEDFSFLGQSLEERIRKKMNGIKDICKGKAKERKNSCDKTPLTNGRGVDSKETNKKTSSSTKEIAEKTDKNRKLSTASNSSSDDAWELEISKIVHESKPINGKYSFLASLSVNVPILQCDMTARIYRNNFKSYKDQLLAKLFKMYNEKVFDNAIPQNTAVEWNDRMRGTAGFCYCKKITKRTGAVERTVRIVLATKVIDAAYRLRDTLLHEMCHAAAWIVNCVSDGHGPYWKSWACKAMKTFPELPPVKRCHDYVINTKYTYRCTGCAYSIGRHSKSLDIERKRCGYCFGKFEVLLNKVSKKGETKSVPATPKKEVTGFALFVKENYSTYKQTNLKHAEVMKLLGQKFQEMKVG